MSCRSDLPPPVKCVCGVPVAIIRQPRRRVDVVRHLGSSMVGQKAWNSSEPPSRPSSLLSLSTPGGEKLEF